MWFLFVLGCHISLDGVPIESERGDGDTGTSADDAGPDVDDVGADGRQDEVSCERGGVSYAVGERIPAGDVCNICVCQPDGSFACTQAACRGSADGCSGYTAGAVVALDDECTDCVCGRDGKFSCTRAECQCEHEGVRYTRGDTFPEDSLSCRQCSCGKDGVTCIPEQCPTCQGPYGSTYEWGQRFSDEMCRICLCQGSSSFCYTPPSCQRCTIGGHEVWALSGAGSLRIPWLDGCTMATCQWRAEGATSVGHWAFEPTPEACDPLPAVEECDVVPGEDSYRGSFYYAEGNVMGVLARACPGAGGQPEQFRLCFAPLPEVEASVDVFVLPVEGGAQCALEQTLTSTRVFDFSKLAAAWQAKFQTVLDLRQDVAIK